EARSETARRLGRARAGTPPCGPAERSDCGDRGRDRATSRRREAHPRSVPGSEAMMPAANAASQPIHITLSLDPATPSRGGTIYVIARGAEGGHPVAV